MMRKLFLLTFVLFCVGCGSPTSNKTSTPNVDALTPEEQLSQRIREWTDSTIKAQAYFKQNLGNIIPEWRKSLDQSAQAFMSVPSTFSNTDKLKIVYSLWECQSTASAWNKQLKGQLYNVSDTLLQQDAICDKKQWKEQTENFPSLRLLYAQECRKTYWIDDIGVRVSGKRNQYIQFIGSRFSKNKRIQEFHDEISETAEVLRFKQVRYSRYDGSDYEYFNVYDGKDSDPIPTILDWQYKWGVFPNTF